MKKDLNEFIIEASVRKVLHNENNYSKRDIRNLIDLGVELSNGRFQKQFLVTAQTMLQDENSQYYQLAKNALKNINHDKLFRFGMNIGYSSCTKGAQTIRKLEEENGFNIPWMLVLEISEDEINYHFYLNFIKEAKKLGIHTFVISILGDPSSVIPLLIDNDNCAFVLLLHSHQVTYYFIHDIKSMHNTMISIYYDDQAKECCQKLKKEKMLYSIHLRYKQEDIEEFKKDEWFINPLRLSPLFLFLYPYSDYVNEEEQIKLYDFICKKRKQQQLPVFLIDIKYDSLFIDKIISNDGYMVSFNSDGYMLSNIGEFYDKESNIFTNSLEDILKTYLPKERND